MTANPPPAFPDGLLQLRTELGVYYRELPRLPAEGESGRIAVVKGTTFHGTWDTFRDAIQYGHDKFPDGQFLAQKIDRRYLDAFAPHFPAGASVIESEAV